MARAYVGTSGFSYNHWKDDFYEGVPQKDWFEHYRKHFPTVEFNATFYRLPKRSTIEKWAREAEDDFVFVLKGSSYLTHNKRLKDPEEPVERFFKLVKEPLGKRLHAVLWQLPPSAKANPERLRNVLDELEKEARGIRQAFEFRHTSWFTDEVFDMLSSYNAAGVVSDAPLQALPPNKGPRRTDQPVVRVPETADFVYVRRHGPAEMYSGTYPDKDVRTDAEWAKQWVDDDRDVYVYYNNDWGGHAVRDAQRLTRRLREQAVLAPVMEQRLH